MMRAPLADMGLTPRYCPGPGTAWAWSVLRRLRPKGAAKLDVVAAALADGRVAYSGASYCPGAGMARASWSARDENRVVLDTNAPYPFLDTLACLEGSFSSVCGLK